MKKIFLTTATIFCLAIGAMAQSDGFFSDWSDYDNRVGDDNTGLPILPQGNTPNDQPAPLGEGLLILTALGAGYAVARRDKR